MNLEKLILPLELADKGFKAGLAAAAAGATALVGAISVAVKATFDWADQMDSLQDIMGVTNKEAAALNFTLRKSGTDTSKFSSGMTILLKGLVKADGELDTVGKSLEEFGINAKDANGKVKDQATLIKDISKKYSSFATQQEKVNFLTETFGRSGAELIDFFDTLAAEGGIDAVADKVERLGLAIDPNRYEQFNRNLEELKLVGLGLAVGFTEKVMPALEGFLEIIGGEGTISDKLNALASEADNFIGNLIEGFATSVDNWVSSGGPEELSSKIIAWVEDLGSGEESQSKILNGMNHLLGALVTAAGKIDWGGIVSTIDTKVADAVNARGQAGWIASGDAFGDWLEGALTGAAVEAPSSNAIVALGNALGDWLYGAMDMASYDRWTMDLGYRLGTSLGEIAKGLQAIASNQVAIVDGFLIMAKATLISRAEEWGVGVYNKVIEWVNKITSAMNAVSVVNLPQLPPMATPGASGARGAGGYGRASGGPVIKGQVYDVLDTYKAEGFVAPANGRIDPVQAQPPFDTREMARLFAEELGFALPQALQRYSA